MTASMPRYALSLAIGVLLAPAAHAQTSTAEPRSEATTLDAVIVSGTARFKGLAKRDASFSITTASPEQIQQAVPQSTADLLKIVPGVWAEPSGGGTGANIFVRGMPSEGDAPFVTMQLDGSPLFPPPTLSFWKIPRCSASTTRSSAWRCCVAAPARSSPTASRV